MHAGAAELGSWRRLGAGEGGGIDHAADTHANLSWSTQAIALVYTRGRSRRRAVVVLALSSSCSPGQTRLTAS